MTAARRSWSASRRKAAIPPRADARSCVRKQVDFIVANDISRSDAGFDADTNAVVIISAEGDEAVPLAPKSEIAAMILDRAEQRLTARNLSRREP